VQKKRQGQANGGNGWNPGRPNFWQLAIFTEDLGEIA
jgi:hypothetical protein